MAAPVKTAGVLVTLTELFAEVTVGAVVTETIVEEAMEDTKVVPGADAVAELTPEVDAATELAPEEADPVPWKAEMPAWISSMMP